MLPTRLWKKCSCTLPTVSLPTDLQRFSSSCQNSCAAVLATCLQLTFLSRSPGKGLSLRTIQVLVHASTPREAIPEWLSLPNSLSRAYVKGPGCTSKQCSMKMISCSMDSATDIAHASWRTTSTLFKGARMTRSGFCKPAHESVSSFHKVLSPAATVHIRETCTHPAQNRKPRPRRSNGRLTCQGIAATQSLQHVRRRRAGLSIATALLEDYLFLCSPKCCTTGSARARCVGKYHVKPLGSDTCSCHLRCPSSPCRPVILLRRLHCNRFSFSVERCHRFVELVALVCQETAQRVEKRSLTQHVNFKLFVVLMSNRRVRKSLLIELQCTSANRFTASTTLAFGVQTSRRRLNLMEAESKREFASNNSSKFSSTFPAKRPMCNL